MKIVAAVRNKSWMPFLPLPLLMLILLYTLPVAARIRGSWNLLSGHVRPPVYHPPLTKVQSDIIAAKAFFDQRFPLGRGVWNTAIFSS